MMDTERLIETHERVSNALEHAQHAAVCLSDLRNAVEHLAFLPHTRGINYKLQAEAFFRSAELCLHNALLQLLRAREAFESQEVTPNDAH